MPTNIFLCHSNNNADFVIEVGQYLERNLEGVFYYEQNQKADQSFVTTVNNALHECNTLVVFLDDKFSEWQRSEANTVFRLHEEKLNRGEAGQNFFLVLLGRGAKFPEIPGSISTIGGFPQIRCDVTDKNAVYKCAQEIVKKLGGKIAIDGLPLNPHLFSYEKDIINFYIKNSKEKKLDPKTQELILKGCPVEWPSVERWNETHKKNRLDEQEIGKFRSNENRVVAAALSNYHMGDAELSWPESCLFKRSLCLLEAGPREYLRYPTDRTLKAAILVSGGIAPGINAVIDGIVQRHWLYADNHNYERNLHVYGIQNGFRAFDSLDITSSMSLLIANDNQRSVLLPYRGLPPMLETSDHAHEGGSILGTSRVDELIDIGQRETKLLSIVDKLRAKDIDILYIIGGDGSMKAAHALSSVANRTGVPLSVVAIPKTMDNDILWVWQSFGFLSAVEKAREVIEHLHTEVKSNPRLCILQLFGSDSGFVVSHAVLASGTGHCDVALIPEIDFSIPGLAKWLAPRITDKGSQIPYGLVVMSETAVPVDAGDFLGQRGTEIGLNDKEKEQIKLFLDLKNKKKRIEGQTNDHLRTAGLKIVTGGLREELPKSQVRGTHWKNLRLFTNEPRHLLRAITPSSSDIISGQRLGTLAVDNALAGYTDFMISQWLTEYVLVPLRLVTLGRKRIPETGIFWKSVLAKTGQPRSLV